MTAITTRWTCALILMLGAGATAQTRTFMALDGQQAAAAVSGPTGVTLMLTGFVLQQAGFVPNAEQSEGARFWIRALYSLFPFVCYVVGALLFARFSLGEAEHERIRAELNARNGTGGPASR